MSLRDLGFALAFLWLAGLLGLVARHIARAERPLDRVLALDVVGLLGVGLLGLLSFWRGLPYYLDVAAAIALLSFVETVAASRYCAERKVL